MADLSIQDKLNTESYNYSEMYQRYWMLTDTLMGGNDVIRAQGKKYLPKFHDESEKGYNNRLTRSYLFAGYSNTIERHAGKPFSVPVKVEGLTDVRLELIEDDVNLEAQNITSFSKALFKDAENHGMSFTLVDMPSSGADGSVQGDIDNNIRPKFIHIPAPCLYYWDDAVIENKRQLTEIIYKDDYRRYRWTRETWQVYKQANEDESRLFAEEAGTRYKKSDSYWILEDEGENELGFIPLVVTYFNRENWMSAKPSLFNLAEQNLKYYQEQSDQDSILRFARTGVYFAKGFSEDEAGAISIGANKVIAANDPASDFSVIEYSGSSINAGQASLDKLKSEMEMTGLKPEMNSTVDSTATGVIVNDSAVNSDLKVWACVIEDSLTKCYELAAQWVGVELAEDFKVTVYKDFTIAGRAEDMAIIINGKMQGVVSAETAFREMQSRGLVSASVDIEAEMERLKNETPVFGGGFGA